jgi:hypothetical protein
VTQLSFAARGLISTVKDLMKIDHIKKFDQRKSPPNGLNCSLQVS